MKPDLNTDELVAKRKNADRIKEFSRQLRHFNKDVLTQQPKLPSSTEAKDLVTSKVKQESARQKALEFAKNIPKPQAPASVAENGMSRVSRSADGTNGRNDGGLYMDDEAVEAAKLQELESKHMQNKAKMDAIKKSLALH